jgi:hypothetical protein
MGHDGSRDEDREVAPEQTYALDDIIVVVMRGSGFTALEQTIMDSGEPDRVIAMREDCSG